MNVKGRLVGLNPHQIAIVAFFWKNIWLVLFPMNNAIPHNDNKTVLKRCRRNCARYCWWCEACDQDSIIWESEKTWESEIRTKRGLLVITARNFCMQHFYKAHNKIHRRLFAILDAIDHKKSEKVVSALDGIMSCYSWYFIKNPMQKIANLHHVIVLNSKIAILTNFVFDR